jgi:hypothetical protein
MTERVLSMTVTLASSVSPEQAKELFAALRLFKGVAKVEFNPADLTAEISKLRAKRESLALTAEAVAHVTGKR